MCNGVASTASGSSKALDPANRSNVELGVQLGEVHVDVQRAYETWVESTEWFSKMAVLFVAWMLFLMKQGMRPLRFACDIADVWKYTPFLTLPWDQEVRSTTNHGSTAIWLTSFGAKHPYSTLPGAAGDDLLLPHCAQVRG